MVNFNGTLLKEETHFLNNANRGLRYGDSLFEAIRVVNGSVYFLEEHYLRLMSSMRILRMEIPMDFTMEFLEAEIIRTVSANEINKAYRVRFTVFRNDGGLYLPETNSISYCIEAKLLNHPFYTISDAPYEVELFKDFFVNKDMLSNLKTNNRVLNVVGSVFAMENDYHNCLLINGDKMVVEALNGNVFLVSGKTVKTPPLKDGCLNGILRKKIIELLRKLPEFEVKEESIAPCELQKADELFITNTISGIIPVYKYRKKIFGNTTSTDLIGKLNAVARLTA